MVIIISDEKDTSTNEVVDWIGLEKQFSLIRNSTSRVTSVKLSDQQIRLNLNGIDLCDVKSYWYRRGSLKMHSGLKISKNEQSPIEMIFQSTQLDLERLQNYFDIHLTELDCISLGSFLHNKVNKLHNLQIAKSVNLSIPKTIITNSRQDLIDYFGSVSIIVKPIGEAQVYMDKKHEVYTYTSIVDIDKLEETFPISLFQEKVDKKYEIRTFVLEDSCYSMAILSQNNEQTAVDFRNYDFQFPNRKVPYTLPPKIEDQVFNFMKKINLKSGSVDFIVTPEDEHIFLEVNPIGQFGMVSKPCNYNIEKKIADYLTNY